MGRTRGATAAVIVAAMLMIVLVPLNEAQAAEPVVVFTTDFEGNGLFIADWEPLGWTRGDYAADHGDDQWCRANGDVYNSLTNIMKEPMSAHSSASALYGNKIGTNSINGAKNVDNAYPDPGMDPWVRFSPPDASRYDGMTLTFYYWARTQAANYTGELTDYLCVNINDGTTTTQVWKQPAPDSNGWRLATVVMPAGTVWMEWEYKTSTETVGHYPGVFIDDMTVTTGRVLPGPPTSHVSGMSAFYNSRDVQVPVSMIDGDRMSLYYRPSGGQWTKYVDSTAPDGLFVYSPITFRAPSDGTFEVFSVASNSTYTEQLKPAAEAIFTVDTVLPTLAITSPAAGDVLGTGTVTVSWTTGDAGSGVLFGAVSMDDGGFVNATGSRTFTGLAEGTHIATVLVQDKALNIARTSVTFLVNLTNPGMTVSPTGSDILTNASIAVTFHEAVEKSSVIVSINGIDGSLAWNGPQAVFTPSEEMAFETTYLVTVTGKDAAGDAFTAQWSFTTVKEGGSISGTVRDADGKPIVNAIVKLNNGMTATTDASGYFEITNVPAGHYTMNVTKNGYVLLSRDVDVTTGFSKDMGSLSTKASDDTEDGYLLLVALCMVAIAGLVAVMYLGRRRR